MVVERCRYTADHEWIIGTQAQWCATCWLTRPLATPLVPRMKREKRSKLKAKVEGARTIRDRVIERDGLHCRYCGRGVVVTTEMREPDALTIDHIIPWSIGGRNTMQNCLVACRECNHLKGNHDVATFVKHMARRGITVVAVINAEVV